jgi:hypothetical protein
VIVTTYSLWGVRLDIDGLLARARPKGKHDVWRRGENGDMGKAVTSGVIIRVAGGTSPAAHSRSVGRFLRRETRFLNAAGRTAGRAIRSDLSTVLMVDAKATEPTPFIEFPSAVLKLAAERRSVDRRHRVAAGLVW